MSKPTSASKPGNQKQHQEGGAHRSVNHFGLGLGLVAGLAFGLVAAMSGSPLLMDVAVGVRPLGTAFVNAIQMVVIPLVVSVIFVGVARLGDPRKVGRMGGLAILFSWVTTIIAIIIGMGLMALGLQFAPDVVPPAIQAQATPELPTMVDFLLNLIPRNPFEAASRGALLPLIVFSLLFGAAAGTLPDAQRERLVGLAESVSEALITLVYWILWTGPVGLFGLTAPITAELGWAMLGSLAVFVITVIIGLILFATTIYMPAVRFLGKMAIPRFIKGSLGACTIGFSTTSSVASLPVLLADAEEKLDVSPEVANLVLPLAVSLNRSGSALFQGASIIFLAWMYDVTIPGSALAGAVLASFLVALTVAPVPSASVMTLVPALDTVGVPVAGLAILLGIDRIPDMARTVVNVMGDMAAAVVVDGITKKDIKDSAEP